MLGNPRLHFNQPLSCLLIISCRGFQFPAHLALFFLKRLFLFLPCPDLRADYIGTFLIVFVIHPHRIDLFFQDIDLAFQLLLQKVRLIHLVSRCLYGEIDLLNFLLNGLVLCFHFVIALVRFFHLGCSQFVFPFQIPDLLPESFLFKKKHIDIISL